MHARRKTRLGGRPKVVWACEGGLHDHQSRYQASKCEVGRGLRSAPVHRQRARVA